MKSKSARGMLLQALLVFFFTSTTITRVHAFSSSSSSSSLLYMSLSTPPPLTGKVALVTGASRGIGRGIALELAMQGATVYATARSLGEKECTEGELGGTLASLVEEAEGLGVGGGGGGGGVILPLLCDHAQDEQFFAVMETILKGGGGGGGGKLHYLVNNAFMLPSSGAKGMVDVPFWEQGTEVWDALHRVGLRSHYVAACAAVPLLLDTKRKEEEKGGGGGGGEKKTVPAIINVGSFGGVSYVFNVAYGVGKAGVDRLSRDMAIELKKEGIASFSLWPGVVLTERMASIQKEDPAKWEKSMGVGEGYLESPRFAGRALAALLSSTSSTSSSSSSLMARSGSIQIVAEVARELGVRDVDGRQPPSIRSLQFLLPNYTLKGLFSSAPFFSKLVPDIKLPLSVMGARPE